LIAFELFVGALGCFEKSTQFHITTTCVEVFVGILRSQLVRVQRFSWQHILPLLLILVIVGCAYLFIELADEVREGETQGFDEWVLKTLRRPDSPATPIGPAWLREAALDATALGSPVVLLLVVGIVVGLMVLQRKYAIVWLTIGSTIGGSLAAFALKHVIGRERPTVVPHLQEVTSPSFPSGHAMLAAVVYLTLGSLLMEVVVGRLAKTYCLGCALLVTFIVGASRIYLGVHYPTDVLAGWMAGLAWSISCWIIAQYVQNGGSLRRETNTITPAKTPP
jgi:undecaprenyl-diphosphatase